MYGGDSSTSGWYVPGFYRGCFIVEALRQSDLRCFFNQYCLEDLIINLNINRSAMYTALDASSLKQFEVDTSIGVIIYALMVDEWTWNVSHAKYYAICQPSKCIYTITTRNSWFSIVMAMVGLIGGLVTALRMTIPRILHLIRSRCKPRTGGSSGKMSELLWWSSKIPLVRHRLEWYVTHPQYLSSPFALYLTRMSLTFWSDHFVQLLGDYQK